LINYIFVGGPAPQQLSLADVNCSGSINIADVVLLINYIFRNGPLPARSANSTTPIRLTNQTLKSRRQESLPDGVFLPAKTKPAPRARSGFA